MCFKVPVLQNSVKTKDTAESTIRLDKTAAEQTTTTKNREKIEFEKVNFVKISRGPPGGPCGPILMDDSPFFLC